MEVVARLRHWNSRGGVRKCFVQAQVSNMATAETYWGTIRARKAN